MKRTLVEKVESSVKGGVVAQPGAKTLILGKNGAGKSAIVNSIELAGTGAASDVAGRAVLAKDADLFMLAPPGAEKVWAQARLSNGAGTAAWELSQGHRAKRVGPEIAFPLRSVRAAILGSPETARKWVLDVSGDFEWSEVTALIPASLHKRVDQLQAGSYPSNSDALIAALEKARERVREENGTARIARANPAPSMPPPTDEEITSLETVISIWRERNSAGSPINVIKEAKAGAEERVATLTAKARAIEDDLMALPAPVAGGEVRTAAVLVIEALVAAQAHDCAICGGKTDPAALAVRASRGRARIAEAFAIEEKRNGLKVAHASVLADLGSARREVERIATEEARAEKRGGAGGPPPALSLPEAEARLRTARDLRAGWTAAKTAEERALAAERESAEWTQVAEALAKALGMLVEKAREAFRLRVQRFLPRADLFGIDLLDGEREVLRIGLLRQKGDRMVLHAALSGAEWARVTAALALATAPLEGPCVVCPEERAFDPETLSEVLAAFDEALKDEEAPQIVVTSPVEPTKVPAGWTVISVGDGVQSTEKPEPSSTPPATGPEAKRRVPRKAKDTELFVDGKGRPKDEPDVPKTPAPVVDLFS